MSVDGLLTRLNPLIALILRSPAHWLLSPGLMLLTFRGRKSGKQFAIPVGYQRDDDVVTVMVSEAREKQWWRNYREAGWVALRLRGRDLAGEAQVVVPGSDEFRQRTERSLRRVPGLSRIFGVEFDRKRGLSAEQVEHLGSAIAVVRIRLDPDP